MKNKITLLVVLIALVVGGWMLFKSNPDILGNNGTPDNTKTPDNAETPENPSVAENPGRGGCYVGGCSGQICSDEAGVASTCEYREAYACYRSATCERQASGQCGWTPSAELQMCLNNAR